MPNAKTRVKEENVDNALKRMKKKERKASKPALERRCDGEAAWVAAHTLDASRALQIAHLSLNFSVATRIPRRKLNSVLLAPITFRT